MAVGDAFEIHELSALEWPQFCSNTWLKPSLVRREIERVVKAVDDVVDFVAIEAFTAVVKRECARQRELASQMRGMMKWA